MEITLTTDSKELFLEFAEDADNWSGSPMVDITNAQRGNLSDLIKKGLVEILQDSPRDGGCTWCCFTRTGVDFAMECGVDLRARCSEIAQQHPY